MTFSLQKHTNFTSVVFQTFWKFSLTSFKEKKALESWDKLTTEMHFFRFFVFQNLPTFSLYVCTKILGIKEGFLLRLWLLSTTSWFILVPPLLKGTFSQLLLNLKVSTSFRTELNVPLYIFLINSCHCFILSPCYTPLYVFGLVFCPSTLPQCLSEQPCSGSVARNPLFCCETHNLPPCTCVNSVFLMFSRCSGWWRREADVARLQYGQGNTNYMCPSPSNGHR